MASSRGMAVLISLVRLASSFSLPATGKVPTFFGCSKFCSDDRRRSSHEFADLAHPGRCTSSCRRWPDSHLPRHRLRSSVRSEEHTSELQSLTNLVCRLLLEKKKKKIIQMTRQDQTQKE